MNLGTAQIDITPQPGLELAGFAKRPQPSTGVADPLYIRSLYFEEGHNRLLWLHADSLGFSESLANQLRQTLGAELALPTSSILLTATHSHSAPAAIALTGCGQVVPSYVNKLSQQFLCATRQAMSNLEQCQLVTVQGHCHLGIDRRGFSSAHTDPRVGVLGWQRVRDGSFKAIFLNYPMHPVCLCNTLMSADWPGAAARTLSEALPGHPVVLVTPGACGNINPPAVGVTPAQMSEWGQKVAETVIQQLIQVKVNCLSSPAPSLQLTTRLVPVPLENWDAMQIEKYASASLSDKAGIAEFGDIFRRVVEIWRTGMLERIRRGKPHQAQIKLGVVSFGQASLLTINAEIFSHFTDMAAKGIKQPVYTVGYANGMLGYIPHAAAYDEGGYEVAWSMLFYNLPRLQKGSLEILAQRAQKLLATLP